MLSPWIIQLPSIIVNKTIAVNKDALMYFDVTISFRVYGREFSSKLIEDFSSTAKAFMMRAIQNKILIKIMEVPSNKKRHKNGSIISIVFRCSRISL